MNLSNLKIRVQLWDTAGQERFRTITNAYYKGAHGVAIVFDITDRASFDMIDTWLREIENHASSEIFKVILGNKADLAFNRKVSETEANNLAYKYGLRYFEVSAKDGTYVKEAFDFLSHSVVSKFKAMEPSIIKERNSFSLIQSKKMSKSKKY